MWCKYKMQEIDEANKNNTFDLLHKKTPTSKAMQIYRKGHKMPKKIKRRRLKRRPAACMCIATTTRLHYAN